jgi:type II secretory pathway component PulK
MKLLRTRNRGTILITAMWVMVILGVVVIIYANQMRTELLAAANRADTNIAGSVELGAEQYVLAAVDNIDGEADYVLGLPGEALQIGSPQQGQQGGYFWLLRPAADEQTYEFGITDECAKVNLNVADATQLLMLPGIQNIVADSIVDWIDTDSNSTNSDGAETSYYEGLTEPYSAKNQPLETVEELRLVEGIDDSVLFGIDHNRNGVIEPGESSQGSMPQSSTGVSANRGIFPFVTVFSKEPNTDMQGNPRINVNALSTGGAGGRNAVAGGGRNGGGGRTGGRGGGGGGGGGTSQAGQQLLQALSGAMSASKAQTAVNAAQTRGPFTSIFDFAQKANLTAQDLGPVADKLSFLTGTATSSPGLINVNTAPREVLLTLPGMESSDVDGLISERSREDTSSIMWVAQAMPINRAAQIGKFLTSRSFIYSADIVAVSFDGRSFKRVRIVVDATASPAKILYRQDITASGWPLPPQIRQSLREGRGPGQSMQDSSASGGSGLGSMGTK